MSRDITMKGDDGNTYSYGTIKSQGWLDGHAPGIEMAVGFLRTLAIEAFNADRDKEADDLKALAKRMMNELVPVAEARAKEYEKTHPEILVEATKGVTGK